MLTQSRLDADALKPRQILAAATKFDVDLIVLTTKGGGGIKRVLLGSTAERVMRHAQCPVMSIRRH